MNIILPITNGMLTDISSLPVPVFMFQNKASPGHSLDGDQIVSTSKMSISSKFYFKGIPAALKAEMGSGLVLHEYATHGYYLPIPIADYYAIMQSNAMSQLKTSCAAIAAGLTNGQYETKTVKGVTIKYRTGYDYIDCTAHARITIKKSGAPRITIAVYP